MPLTEKEKQIIAAVQLRADTPLAQIAKNLHLKEHTVRYAMHSLLERDMLRPHTLINLTALGYTEYEVLFSLSCPSAKTVRSFLEYLTACPRVTWLAAVSGDYQYVMILSAHDVGELADFFDNLFDRFGHIICDKEVANRISLTYFRRKYLYPPKQKIEAVEIKRAPAPIAIDVLDRRILESLSQSPELSHRRQAEQLGLPYSTFVDRVKHLKHSGVIVAFIYVLNFLHYGMYMYRLLLDVKGVNSEIRNRLLRFCTTHPYITSFTQAIGSWDVAVGAEVERPDRIVEITRSFYELCGKELNSVRVLSRFGNLKWQMCPAETSGQR
jgi:DNA-binding Lrp family transcriptional regulator